MTINRKIGRSGTIVIDGPAIIQFHQTQIRNDPKNNAIHANITAPETVSFATTKKPVKFDMSSGVNPIMVRNLILTIRGKNPAKMKYVYNPQVFQILEAIDHFLAAHEEWHKTRTAENPFNLPGYSNAVNALFGGEQINEHGEVVGHYDGAFIPNRVPAELRVYIEPALNGLLQKVHDYDNDPSPPRIPPVTYFMTVDNLQEKTKHFYNSLNVPKTIEPMQVLAQQGVTTEQIAKMYHMFIPSIGGGNDTPDIISVEKELKNPGSVIDDNWVFPPEADRRQWAAEFLENKKRYEQEKETNAVLSPLAPAPKTIAPEAIWDLVQQGVDAPQLALMKDVTEEKATEWIRKVSQNIDPSDEDPFLTRQSPAQPQNPSTAPQAPEFQPTDSVTAFKPDGSFAITTFADATDQNWEIVGPAPKPKANDSQPKQETENSGTSATIDDEHQTDFPGLDLEQEVTPDMPIEEIRHIASKLGVSFQRMENRAQLCLKIKQAREHQALS